jgi:hypothetical protein
VKDADKENETKMHILNLEKKIDKQNEILARLLMLVSESKKN